MDGPWRDGRHGKTCEPLGGQQSEKVSTAERVDGLETTEYFESGAYRVTRCDSTGDLERSVTMAPIRGPEGKVELLPVGWFDSPEPGRGGGGVSGTFHDPSLPGARERWEKGRLELASHALPPTEPRAVQWEGVAPARSSARRGLLQGDTGCSTWAYTYIGPVLWPGSGGGGYEFRNRYGGWMPATYLYDIAVGLQNWDYTVNPCSFPDVTNITHTYAGTTPNSPQMAPDGVNVVDFGSMTAVGCSSTHVACTFWYTSDGVFFSNVDMRFDQSAPWSLNGAGGTYDVQSVATHEGGHSIGLSEVNAFYLTMHETATAGTFRRSLGLGDAVGLRCRYGVTAGGC